MARVVIDNISNLKKKLGAYPLPTDLQNCEDISENAQSFAIPIDDDEEDSETIYLLSLKRIFHHYDLVSVHVSVRCIYLLAVGHRQYIDTRVPAETVNLSSQRYFTFHTGDSVFEYWLMFKKGREVILEPREKSSVDNLKKFLLMWMIVILASAIYFAR